MVLFMEEENKKNSLDEIMKDSTLNNPELTFCEKTTYLDFLLSNAKTEEEKEDIKNIINNFLEISKEDDEEETKDTEEEIEDDDVVEIEKVELDSTDLDDDDEEKEIEYQDD